MKTDEKRMLIIVFTMLLASCANQSMEPYRVPDSITSYATIIDRPPIISTFEYEKIVSIDRKLVDSKSRGLPEGVGSNHSDLEYEKIMNIEVKRVDSRLRNLPRGVGSDHNDVV